MGARLTRRGLLVVFGATAVMLVAAAVGWACTFPVGQTEIVSPDDGEVEVGETLEARSEVWSTSAGAPLYDQSVDFFGEHDSPCGDFGEDVNPLDAECVYDLGLVNPTDYEEAGHSDTCHYETPESHDSDSSTGDIDFAVIDDDPAHTPHPDTPGVRTVEGSGEVPDEDAGGETMGTGETVACFYSSALTETNEITNDLLNGDASPLNGQENGAATATLPAPIVVVD